ncbi:uncharacterized protein LOC144137583 [Haemaphysalis longicornis]
MVPVCTSLVRFDVARDAIRREVATRYPCKRVATAQQQASTGRVTRTHPPVPTALTLRHWITSSVPALQTACQTEEVVCPISELLAVKGQLRSTTQRLRRSQMKLAKMTALAIRHKRQHTDTQKLSAREKLIFDQCLMKANAKSPTDVSDLILAKSRGFLQAPSSRLLSLLQIVESYVEELTVSRVACTDVYLNIVERVLLDERTSAAPVGCRSHYVGTTAEVVHFFLRCRLHFFTREKNKLARASKRATCPAGGGKKVIS